MRKEDFRDGMVHGPGVSTMYSTCVTVFASELRRDTKLTFEEFTSKLDDFRMNLRYGTYQELCDWYEIAKG
jgi:hypothetical protein